jgi:uncharacterized protein
MSDTRQTLQPEDPIEIQLRDVEARLITRGQPAGVPAERVRAAVRDAAAGFTDAAVRTFVPVLVERAVRERLSL